MNRGVWHATVHGVTKSQTELMTEYACYVCVCVCVCVFIYKQNITFAVFSWMGRSSYIYVLRCFLMCFELHCN